MNKVILIGNLVSAPEMRQTQSGIACANFRLAVQRRFKNQAGEREADFINVVAWRQLAELCGKFLDKGSKCGVVGWIMTRSYDGSDGNRRYITEVVAEEIGRDGNGNRTSNSHDQPGRRGTARGD